ncbi:MAG: ribonuclease III [Holosporales bacterium]|jgi:ribonuclease-3|nr:ribonuclease III [Holosporales bacterium]
MDLVKIQENIGYKFRNKSLLIMALCHSSVAKKDRSTGFYERGFDRLEFLGDRVLNMSIAELLYTAFPTEDEGSLSKRYIALVCFETCARVAININLEEFLEVAKGTSLEELRILCDALEALLGAMYLDNGLHVCQEFVKNNWSQFLFQPIAPPQDPKSKLQELVQSKGYALPEYTVLKKDGQDHSPSYTVAVRVKGQPNIIGIGQSKKAAEKNAATKMLHILDSSNTV